MGANVTYAASIYQDQESGKIECTVTQSVQAGVSGPALSFEIETTDLHMVDIELAKKGYTRTDAWALGTTCQGMELNTVVKPAQQGKEWGDL